MQNIVAFEKLMIDAGITELEFRSATIELSIRTGSRASCVPPPRSQAIPTFQPVQPLEVRSRLVGNFQQRHKTRRQPQLNPGAKVTRGETLGFVRDGLVLYPVIAPQSGTVKKIAHAPGAPVGYGSVLFEIEVTASP